MAVERSDRDVVALIKRERLAGRVPVSHGGVVAQVSRGGTGRHLAVARLLAGTDIAAPDDRLRRRASVLLARSGLADAIDVAVVSLAADGEDPSPPILATSRYWLRLRAYTSNSFPYSGGMLGSRSRSVS